MGSKDRHIVFFTSSMGDGGAQRTIANLAAGFSEKGYTVDLLLLSAEGPYLEQLPSSVKVIEIDAGRALSSILKVRSYLKSLQPDVLCSTMEYLNVTALLAGFGTDVDILIRGANLRSMKHRSGMIEWIQFGLATVLYRTADAIVAVSEDARDDFANYYHLPIESINTIYNPVMIDEIRRQADEQVSLPSSDTAIRLISVGRLSEEKDTSTAIRALAHLRDTHDVELLLLGEGEQQEQLETLAAELNVDNYVHFFGFVDNPFPYMRAADALVLSSKSEGFGHVIVEAMACGTPVVATDCPGGPSEIIDDGTYGQLVPVGDHEALAEAITATLANPIEKKRLLERARRFEYDKITEAHIDLLF